MTHIDTAEMYGDGAAEEIVAEALDSWHDDAFVATKVLPGNASRRGTIAACERSLRRLGREQIDLYLLHWAGHHPLEDTIAAFEELRESGKIRYYGVSNFDADELHQAAEIAGPGSIACNQVLYHLEERAIEHSVEPACAQLEAAVVAYSPFGSGAFPEPGSAARTKLDEVARACGATPYQVALAFLTRRSPLFAIPKAATSAHVEDNAAAADLVLDEAQIAELEAAFPLGPEPASLPVI